MLLADFASRVIEKGRLTLIGPDGVRHDCVGAAPGPEAAVRLHDGATVRRIMLDPQLAVGEAYMEGALTMEEGDVGELLAVLIANVTALGRTSWLHRLTDWWRFATRRIAQHNPIGKAQANIAHHYDLSAALYDAFLDRDRFYSCAYFPPGVEDLDAAQAAKVRHLAAKLQIAPGQSVLDIGAGWGGLALHLARRGAARVTGVTLSREQHAWAKQRLAEAGLSERVDIRLQDYRTVTGPFDRIVSVGMFEHVGVGHYREYFETVRDLLAEDGCAVIHAIGRSGPPGFTNPFIAKYIFPGGYIPALSEVLPVIERTGLIVTDVEILRLHYAETLRHWRARFLAHWDALASRYDARFKRMWEFYLAGSEMSFRHGDMMVFQIQLAKTHAAVPLTRDYITDDERGHRLEHGAPQAAE